MSKELEALKTIKIKCHPNSNPSPLVDEALDTIENALKRIEAIDNANPSEALECSLKLYKMVESAGNGNGFSLNEAWKYHNIIKQSLLKAQANARSEEILQKYYQEGITLDSVRALKQENVELKAKAQEQEHNFEGSKEFKIEIPESGLMDYNPVKHYLKWEDLEFGVPTSLPATIKVKMGDTQYLLSLRISLSDVKSVVLRDTDLKPILHIYEKEKQFFNDLHLERVE